MLRLLNRLGYWLRHRPLEADLAEELEFHRNMKQREFEKTGLPAVEASSASRRALGNVVLAREDSRAVWIWPWLESVLQDLKYASRTMRKMPGFTSIAVLALTIGIGSATTIFSVVYNVLLEPFPYKGSDRLVNVAVHDSQRSEPGGRPVFSVPEFLDYQDQNHIFEGVIGTRIQDVLFNNGEGTEQFRGAAVTPNTFSFLGIPALLGRTITSEDAQPAAPPVAVLSYKIWTERFHQDRGILGRNISLNGKSYTVIGVISTRFGWWAPDVWLPGRFGRSDPDARQTYLFLQARLKRRVTLQQAVADLTVVANRLSRLYREDYPKKFTIEVQSVTDFVVGRFRTVLYSLLAAVELLLLIACANVANMLLARASAREKEIAIRAAIGAGRWRIIRQLLMESMLLGVTGAVGGCLLAYGGIKGLVAVIPTDTIADESVISLNVPVLLFSIATAVITALLFGLAPALHACRQELIDGLRDSGKGVSSGFRHGRLRKALVVAEVALSLVLLVGAGLMMRTFISLIRADLGFNPNNILFARLVFPIGKYESAVKKQQLVRPLIQRLAALPGVVAAGEALGIPPYGGAHTEFDVPGKVHTEKWSGSLQLCSEGFFPAIGYRFLRGRPFSSADVIAARKVAVVNQTLAKQYFGTDDPIGHQIEVKLLQTIKPDPVQNPLLEIIGVVVDTKNQGIRELTIPEVFVPGSLAGWPWRGIIVRSSNDPVRMLNAIQREIWAVDRNVAMTGARTLPQILRSDNAQPRFSLIVLSLFAIAGLTLVAIGVYSIMSYTVSRQIHEIGVRMALGAERRTIFRDVLRNGAKLLVFGIGAGVLMSVAGTRIIASQLWNVPSYDPLTLTGGAVVVTIAGLSACLFPAFRATRVDAMTALRHE